MNTLIVIVGPTGVGKTALCIDVAKQLDTVIINADSRQMFKEIPIGTAAPTDDEQNMVKHYFIGNLCIKDYYNASMFENEVITLLGRLFHEKDVVILSGGSMMYVDAVCNGIDDIPTVNEHIRNLVKEDYERHGLSKMQNKLKELDPEYYSIVDKNNPKRVIHAVEICLSTGRTYTSFRTNIKKERPFRIIKIGLTRERGELYGSIDERVENMIASGLIDEARRMHPYKGLNALNTVGYKELFDYFDGNCTLEEAIFRIKCNTHKYCRKQLTWFKRDKDIRWFSPDNVEEIINYIRSFC
ncbi:MAG TPA: tRNA (adenosine(37)-N6)-dimethylallyltransferase MiaA [Candidatus Prevotella stercoripullorum]|nr:tRNA (adenosine(37)-N6)-dimethylallyltransferase MiaA [Candidatus Prevotella stercoripullorum]